MGRETSMTSNKGPWQEANLGDTAVIWYIICFIRKTIATKLIPDQEGSFLLPGLYILNRFLCEFDWQIVLYPYYNITPGPLDGNNKALKTKKLCL